MMNVRILLCMKMLLLAILHDRMVVLSAEGSDFTLEIMKDQIKIILQRLHHFEVSNYTSGQSCLSKKLPIPQIQPSISVYRDCAEVYLKGFIQSGIYVINIFHGFYSIPVYCDMETVGAFSGKKGWMTIQRRMNGEVSFDRGWADYLHGFGFPDKEHWIGLRNILAMTKRRQLSEYNNRNLMLRIDIEDWDGNRAFVEHKSFGLLSEKYDFEIDSLGQFKGSMGLKNALVFSLSAPFSTRDHNNDRRRNQACIQEQKGGWWFGSCLHINLNGEYSIKREVMTKSHMFIRSWRAVNPNATTLRYISMKLQ